MKKKAQLDDIDVVFDPTPLTEAEKMLISDYIRADKARLKKRQYKQSGTKVKHTEATLLR